jgi:hypothetical protein
MCFDSLAYDADWFVAVTSETETAAEAALNLSLILHSGLFSPFSIYIYLLFCNSDISDQEVEDEMPCLRH